jgi:hypothetical protein
MCSLNKIFIGSGEKMAKKIIISIVSGIIGIIAFYSIQNALSPVFENMKFTSNMKKAAKILDKDCPYAVNDELIIEKISYAKNRTLVYEYRYIYYSKSDFDLGTFKNTITQRAIDFLGSDNSLNGVRNKDVIYEYIYYDNQYEEIGRTKILLNTPIKAVE